MYLSQIYLLTHLRRIHTQLKPIRNLATTISIYPVPSLDCIFDRNSTLLYAEHHRDNAAINIYTYTYLLFSHRRMRLLQRIYSYLNHRHRHRH